MQDLAATIAERVRALPIWSGGITISPLGGGITNHNLLVVDGLKRFVVRLGEDIPVHGVMRFNELAAARAAHAAGLSPEVMHAEPGLIVSRWLPGRSLTPEDMRDPGRWPAIVDLLRRCHTEVGRRLRGPVLAFWVFQVIRSYLGTLRDDGSRLGPRLAELAACADRIEDLAGPVTIAFCHNDLLAANLHDDGDRLWLLDFDYAGLNSPLFDLANLAGNNGFAAADETAVLTLYAGRPPDRDMLRTFAAFRTASLLREALWSAVSERHSRIAFDFVAYTDTNLALFDAALAGLADGDGPSTFVR